jgi:hypothetical protein
MREVRTTAPDISNYPEEFIVGNLDSNSRGFPVPTGSIGIVIKVVEPKGHPDEMMIHVMVPDGRIGWVYPEDCETFSETW